MKLEPPTAEYRCPGEEFAISRAVHLARLADGHSACRDCRHREDSAGISAKRRRRLEGVFDRPRCHASFVAEGVEFTAIDLPASRAAAAIAREFARRFLDAAGDDHRDSPTFVVAGDGRLAAAGLLASIIEAVCWCGCHVVDIGAASSPCAAMAIEKLGADGGILLGNPAGAAHTAALKFWDRLEPLSQGPLLDGLAAPPANASPDAKGDRPARAFGRRRNFDAATAYRQELQPAYHALRPLRLVLRCRCEPVVRQFDELLRNVTCRVIPGDGLPGDSVASFRGPPLREPQDGLGSQVAAADAHFGIDIGDDGESCRVFDERGRPVPAERLFALMAGAYDSPARIDAVLRQDAFRGMCRSRADFGLDAAGRLWYAAGHAPRADALRTLTQLLVLLSRDDRPFSTVA